MTTNDNKIRRELRDLMAEAADPDQFWNASDLTRAGIPSRYVAGLARASQRISTPAEAQELADETADEIIADLHRFDGLTPTELAAKTLPTLY